jgi:signal transduction histidine kinase
MGILGGLGIAGLFYFAAEYEHMTGWKWALASLAITATVNQLFTFSFIFVLPAQFLLFCALAWANSRRLKALEIEREGRRADDQRVRRERISRAQQEADHNPALAAREAEREAADDAARRERQERVRLAREQREQEERDRKPEP